jgi:hypothetical protein
MRSLREAVITACNGRSAVSCLLGRYGRAVNRDPNVHSHPLQRNPTFDCPRLQSINKHRARHHGGHSRFATIRQVAIVARLSQFAD